MVSQAADVTPSVMKWARETAGLSAEKAATKLGLTSTKRSSATEKLEALERGDAKPTRDQLLKIANMYRRPLTVFYRPNPPETCEISTDFRSKVLHISPEEDAILKAILRDIRVRQDMVRSILEDDEGVRPLEFVGSMPITMNIVDAAQTIKQALGISNYHAFQRGLSSPNKLFAALREKVEKTGVFVLLVGNLGSHHTNISELLFRGFAISDDIVPFIVINDQDASPARSFTLIHELVHIFTGSTGVSDAISTVAPNTELDRVERFCNDVSGEFLLPLETLQDFVSHEEAYRPVDDVISNIADVRNVSEAMVAYRLWRIGQIDGGIYREMAAKYAKRWRKIKQKSRKKNTFGPIYYTVRKHRLGNALIDLVGSTLRANELTHTKAAKILGVKPNNVEALLKKVQTVNGSYLRGTD